MGILFCLLVSLVGIHSYTNITTIQSTYWGGVSLDYGFKTYSLENGDYVVLGDTFGDNFTSLVGTPVPQFNNCVLGIRAFYVSYHSGNGSCMWWSCVGGPGATGGASDSFSIDVVVDKDKFVYAAGYTKNNQLPKVKSSFGGGADGVLMKFEPTGNLSWTQYVGGFGSPSTGEAVRAIAMAYETINNSSGNYNMTSIWVVGDISGAGVSFLWTRTCPQFSYTQTIFVRKYDTDGNIIYSTCIGGGSVGINSLIVDSINQIILFSARPDTSYQGILPFPNYPSPYPYNPIPSQETNFVIGAVSWLGNLTNIQWINFAGSPVGFGTMKLGYNVNNKTLYAMTTVDSGTMLLSASPNKNLTHLCNITSINANQMAVGSDSNIYMIGATNGKLKLVNYIPTIPINRNVSYGMVSFNPNDNCNCFFSTFLTNHQMNSISYSSYQGGSVVMVGTSNGLTPPNLPLVNTLQPAVAGNYDALIIRYKLQQYSSFNTTNSSISTGSNGSTTGNGSNGSTGGISTLSTTSSENSSTMADEDSFSLKISVNLIFLVTIFVLNL